jgi:hypothetical protein
VSPASGGEPAYAVRVEHGEQGWEVRIVDAAEQAVSVRACTDETEARTYASTVIQHLGWLSTKKFRQYYRL